ncbi:MAG: hypothetical protein AB7L94_25525 [Kofleriaceae bacterium]
MFTTTAFRLALAAATLASFAGMADAKPRRLVILDFDGPRGLADAGREEVVSVLGEQYDVVAKRRWEEARAKAQAKSAGPATWKKAAKTSGVDAVIEGWISDDGRHKQLTVQVREAATGAEIDNISVRLSQKGLSTNSREKLTEELNGILQYIEGAPEPLSDSLKTVDARKLVGAKPRTEDDYRSSFGDEDRPRKKAARYEESEDEELDETPRRNKRSASIEDEIEIEGEAPKAKDKEVATAADIETKENQDLVTLFGATSTEGQIADAKASHVPEPTKRFRVGAGFYYGSRSFNVLAENQEGPQQYSGVPSKGLEINAAVYPFPKDKFDSGLNGIGFTAGISKSAGSWVTFDDGEEVGEYAINQSAYNVGVHYRHNLASLIAIDGGATYGHSIYKFPDVPEAFETPDTDYSYFGLGAKLDLNIANKATVGFGGRYMYILDTGDVTSQDFFGPGRASGYGLDIDFTIPLPKDLFVRGALAYDKYTIEYDGVGTITDEEGVYESNDSTVNGSVNVGISF